MHQLSLISSMLVVLIGHSPAAAQTIQDRLHVKHAAIHTITLPAQLDSEDLQVSVSLEGKVHILKLRAYSLRAQDFRVLVQTSDGLEAFEPPPPSTWRGVVLGHPGSSVAASILNGQLYAILRLGDNTLWAVQPLGDKQGDQHAIYRIEDVKSGEWLCGTDEPPAATPGAEPRPRGGGGPYLTEIAFDADVEYYQLNGSSVSATVADIEAVMNAVEAIFLSQASIPYVITVIIVRTAEPDPYASSNSIELLAEFRNHWNLVQGGKNSVVRDVAHLMTGKDLEGNTVGRAYVGVICNPFITPSKSYGLSQSAFSTNFALRTALTAHELGHNWNACHCDEASCTGGGQDADCGIMCSVINGCAGGVTSFGTRALDAIIAWRDTANCLGDFPDCNNNAVHDYTDIYAGTSLDCNNNGIPDECDQDCNTNGIPDACDIVGGFSQDCNANGQPDECDIVNGTSVDKNKNGVPDECEFTAVLAVKADATGKGDGSSWEDAFPDLQEALAVALAAPGVVEEIWVAEGTYKAAAPGGPRDASFELVGGVAMYGGFNGTELTRDQRNPVENPVVLSGDLNDDDIAVLWGWYDPSSWGENSYHVVRADAGGVIFDGFIVTHGNANVAGHRNGGGMWIESGAMQIQNCTFVNNYAQYGGGGVVNYGGDGGLFVNCVFIENYIQGPSDGGGGFMAWNSNDGPTLVGCTFAGNSTGAGGRGGGLFYINNNRPQRLINCLFTGNSAGSGGGGGVMVWQGGFTQLRVYDCTFGGNTTTGSGGGIATDFSANIEVANCIVWGNSDSKGAGGSSQIDGSATVTYSCVQGGWTGPGGIGNMNSDPLFRDASGPDAISGTEDDDLRLLAGSPAIDVGSNGAVPADLADLDTDGDQSEPTPVDLTELPRFYDDLATPDCSQPGADCGTPPIVDMGAYEFIPDCNSNGVPDEADISSGFSFDCNANSGPDECEIAAGTSFDCNVNGILDECDIATTFSQDCNANGVPDECEEDCNVNGMPDECDIAGGTSLDCNANGMPDECDITGGTSLDCNTNGMPDECDITGGTSLDCNTNGIPDECDIAAGTSVDCNGDGIPNECQLIGSDCNSNSVPDQCDIAGGTSLDCDTNGVPDECEVDCNANGVPDACDITGGTSLDCNGDGIPDECQLIGNDCNSNSVPDECELADPGNCCEVHGGIGCTNPLIEACICLFDPFCCGVTWDSICVEEVESLGCGLCNPLRDCNTNGVPDECDPEYSDISVFVDQLLAGVQDPILVCMFDQDDDATLGGRDIQPYVLSLIGS